MKRKGIFALLIALPLLLTSCDDFGHVHNWSPYLDNGDGTHYRMCYKDSRHIETNEHNYVEEVITEATNTTPGKILKKCKDCGHEEEVRVNPTGQHIYDQDVVSEKYLYEKSSDYSSIYYKSSTDGAYGDDSKLFEKTLLPEGYSNIEYLQGSGTEFIDTGIERTESTSISYNICKRGNGRLPYDYQEVEYIEFTGTQWIDTSINGDATWDFSLQWTQTQERQLMGYGGSGGEYFGVNNGYYAIYQVSETPIGNKDEVKFMYEGMNGALYVNGTRAVNGGYEAGASNKTFAVGSLHGKAFCQFKLYSLVVTKAGNKVAEFVPCYNTESGEIGLYDLVTCEFFGNSGTGNFLKGSDVNPGSRLPADYQEVEYLESTGTQYIDTGISAVGGIETKFGAEWTTGNDYLVGSHGDAPNYNRNGAYLTNEHNWEFGYGDTYSRFGEGENNIYYDVEFSSLPNNAYLKVNGNVLCTSSGQELTTELNILLFGSQYSKKMYDVYSAGKLYYVKLYKDSVLVRDLVPCYKKTNQEPGFFDLVTNQFFVNSGTGVFEVGRDVNPGARLPAEYQEVEFLTSPGESGAYIKTDYFPNQDSSFTTEFEIPSFGDNDVFVFGGGGEDCADRAFEIYTWSGKLQFNYCGIPKFFIVDGTHFYFESNANNYLLRGGGNDSGSFDYVNCTAPNELTLFAINRTTKTTTGNKDCKIYNFEISESGTLIHDYVSCYLKRDGTPGFYDLITGEFLTNSGTGEFEVGPDVVKPSGLPSNFTRLDYIEGTGTQFIDTGYTINKDDNVVLSLDYAANNKDNLWCGANWYLQFSNNYLNDLNRHIYRIENVNGFETIKCDGSTLTTNDFTSVDKSNIKVGLFKLGNDNNTWHTAYQPLSGKLYEATLELDDVIILDLVPCIENNTGEVGLFDLIHQRFLNNCGEGKFVAGYKNNKTITRGDSPKENVKVGYRYIGEEPTYFYGRIYDATIINGNTVLQKLIPALRNSDSAVGMYDLISGKFYEQTGNFKNSGVVGHHLDSGVVTKEATLDEEGDITYTCSICGAEIHKEIPRLAYKVNFSYDEGIKEIRIHYDNNPSHYEVSNFAYTRNPFSFNYSITNASVWFEVICQDGYELDKVEVPFLSCLHTSKEGIEYLLLIQSDLEVNITSKQIVNE